LLCHSPVYRGRSVPLKEGPLGGWDEASRHVRDLTNRVSKVYSLRRLSLTLEVGGRSHTLFPQRKLFSSVISLSFLFLSYFPTCFGANVQPSTRSVSGIVTDQNGNPVKGAVVLIENTALLRVRSYITQGDGKYHFFGLYWDVDYRLEAKYEGAKGPTKTLSQFDSREAKVINLRVRAPE